MRPAGNGRSATDVYASFDIDRNYDDYRDCFNVFYAISGRFKSVKLMFANLSYYVSESESESDKHAGHFIYGIA